MQAPQQNQVTQMMKKVRNGLLRKVVQCKEKAGTWAFQESQFL